MDKKMMPTMLLVAIISIAAIVFTVQGVGMHQQVAVEEAKFHALQQEYFIINKAEREAAPTGSVLNQTNVEIQNFPSELLRLKLVGVGKILTGIFLLLFVIMLALLMMPSRLAKLLQKQLSRQP